MDLIEFLRARLDEDAAVALAAQDEWRDGAARARGEESPSMGWWDVPERSYEHAQRWNPARVLAEIQAKRQALLTRDQGVCTCGGYENPPTDPDIREPIPHHYDCAAYDAARMFVQPYAGHSDFDPAW